MTFEPTVGNCDDYLQDRTGKYEFRAVRYRAAAEAMLKGGLDDTMTVFDIGAGMTEFDYCLRREYNWRGRYIPIDGGIDGTDIDKWYPPRDAHWFVALEILEHLDDPYILAIVMKNCATRGVIFSTPNPRTTDVLGMDPTHTHAIDGDKMRRLGYDVSEQTFYGGVFSNGEPDSLFGVYYAQ